MSIEPTVRVKPVVTPETLEPGIAPGDFVAIDPDLAVNGDMPLRSLTMLQTLEHEAFTGRSDHEVSGWARKGQVLFVVCVDGDETYLWAREGRGWFRTQWLVRIQSIGVQPAAA